MILPFFSLRSRPSHGLKCGIGTMSERVTANAVDVEAETLARDLRRNCKRRAGCRHIADQNGGGRSGGDGPAACNPVDREGDANRGCIFCISLLVLIFLARLSHSSKAHRWISCGIHATCKVRRSCRRKNARCICQQEKIDRLAEKIDHLFAKHVCLFAAAVLENRHAGTEFN